MKSIQRLISFLLFTFLCSVSAYATPELDQRVKELTTKLKESSSYSSLADFVHWPTALESLNLEERKKLEIKTAEDLKARVVRVLTNPTELLNKEWKRLDETLTPAQREIIKPQFDNNINQAASEWAKKNAELAERNYIISKTTIKKDSDNKTAIVELKDAQELDASPWKLTFELINGKWYLPSLELDQNKSMASLLGPL